MKQFLRVVTVVSGIFGTIFLAFDWLLTLWLKMNHQVTGASSVGIIGGADGPTAIFLTTNTTSAWRYAIAAVLYLISIAGIIGLRNEKICGDPK